MRSRLLSFLDTLRHREGLPADWEPALTGDFSLTGSLQSGACRLVLKDTSGSIVRVQFGDGDYSLKWASQGWLANQNSQGECPVGLPAL